jgi:hypothetical protein
MIQKQTIARPKRLRPQQPPPPSVQRARLTSAWTRSLCRAAASGSRARDQSPQSSHTPSSPAGSLQRTQGGNPGMQGNRRVSMGGGGVQTYAHQTSSQVNVWPGCVAGPIAAATALLV